MRERRDMRGNKKGRKRRNMIDKSEKRVNDSLTDRQTEQKTETLNFYKKRQVFLFINRVKNTTLVPSLLQLY
jgi:hypothetical protein